MVLKKINALVALLSAIMLVDHTVACGILMMLDRINESEAVPAYILMGLVGVHAVISMLMITVFHDGSSTKYGELYRATILQRVSGILMLIPIMGHILISDKNGIAYGVLHILLVVLSLLHTSVSVPNALVTMGVVKSMKSHKVAFIISAVISAVVTIIGITGGIMMFIRM